MIYVWLTLFILLVIVFWSLNFFGLPGNWLIVAMAALWIWLGPTRFQFSWKLLILLILLALIGEAIEFTASVIGTKQMGGSRRGATLSVIGSIVGGIVGAIMGVPIPIPIVGILIGSVLFASLGAMIGAMIGEHTHGKAVKDSVRIGSAAFVGRLLGTAGKIIIGSSMMVLTVIAPFFF